jgi:hypothetical protein
MHQTIDQFLSNRNRSGFWIEHTFKDDLELLYLSTCTTLE